MSVYSQLIFFLNLLVILLCLSSFLLCMRSLFRAEMLKLETNYLLLRNYDMALTVGEKLEFLNLWYVMICVNDFLIIGGSSVKLMLELKQTEQDLWDLCRLVMEVLQM